jgi:transcriptional regulator with XRE-family HTH domain
MRGGSDGNPEESTVGVQRFAPAVLRRARTAAGLSTDRLGVLVGVSGATVSRWESGQHAPSPPHLVALAEALDLPIDDLVRIAADQALLVHLRERAGLTAATAARALNISLAAYSRLERGIDQLGDERIAAVAHLYAADPVEVIAARDRTRRAMTRPIKRP